uniref:hypothetical protein n=1 Tax=Paenibacillus koleovorans TaxID=121608 RepID=UPI0013E3A1FA
MIAIGQSQHTITLENNHLQAVFSKETGALLSLSDTRTDWAIQRRPELGRSFCLLVPLEHRRDNHVYGIDQAPPVIETVSDDTVTFTWDPVTSDYGGELPIRFTGIVRITENDLEFTAAIDNDSAYIVEAAYWPILGDLSMAAETREANWLYLTHGQHQIPLYPKFAGQAYYRS